MKLGKGSSFTTRHTFPGVLPALPDFGGCEAGKLKGYIDSELRSLQNARIGDTYWEGKRLGKIASLVPIAEQAGHTEGVDAFSSELAARLEMWFSATNGAGALKSKGVFYYNQNWVRLSATRRVTGATGNSATTTFTMGISSVRPRKWRDGTGRGARMHAGARC